MSIPDWRVLIVQAGGFILLLIVFKLFLFTPIMGILDARRREVEGQYTDAETQRAAAEELKANYEQHLLAIEEETRAKVADAVKEGHAMRDEIIADSRAKADSILAKAEAEIQRQKETAMAELKTAVADLAVGAAGRIIDEDLNDDRHRALVARFVDELDGVQR